MDHRPIRNPFWGSHLHQAEVCILSFWKTTNLTFFLPSVCIYIYIARVEKKVGENIRVCLEADPAFTEQDFCRICLYDSIALNGWTLLCFQLKEFLQVLTLKKKCNEATSEIIRTSLVILTELNNISLRKYLAWKHKNEWRSKSILPTVKPNMFFI